MKHIPKIRRLLLTNWLSVSDHSVSSLDHKDLQNDNDDELFLR